jgi:hypothetical protein
MCDGNWHILQGQEGEKYDGTVLDAKQRLSKRAERSGVKILGVIPRDHMLQSVQVRFPSFFGLYIAPDGGRSHRCVTCTKRFKPRFFMEVTTSTFTNTMTLPT